MVSKPVSASSAKTSASALGGEVFHELVLALLDLLVGEILFVRGNRPRVARRIGERSRAITPELILELAHRAAGHLRARGNRAVEQGVAIIHVQPQRGG